MTHGQVTFFDSEGKNPIYCYAYHDGHEPAAIEDLLQLPLRIFQKQKSAHQKAYSEPEDLSGLKECYWVYDQHMEFAVDFITDQWSYKAKNGMNKPDTKQDLYNSWLAGIPFDTNQLAVANWFCQQQFNRWNVVPKSWCSYPNKNIRVRCNGGRLGGYLIRWNLEAYESEPEQITDLEEKFRDFVAKLNKKLPDSEFQLNRRFENEPVTINCHYKFRRKENIFYFTVPFDCVYLELFWQDVEYNYKLISENRVAEDPYLERLIKIKTQQYKEMYEK